MNGREIALRPLRADEDARRFILVRNVAQPAGASVFELLIQLFIVLTLAPVIICCVVQGVTTIAAIAFPWIALVLIVIGVGACFAAVLGSYHGGGRNYGPPPDGGVPLLPPVRRPGAAGQNGNGRDRREH